MVMLGHFGFALDDFDFDIDDPTLHPALLSSYTIFAMGDYNVPSRP
jgi:hypothetical protein